MPAGGEFHGANVSIMHVAVPQKVETNYNAFKKSRHVRRLQLPELAPYLLEMVYG
jgi:hypothetical protein